MRHLLLPTALCVALLTTGCSARDTRTEANLLPKAAAEIPSTQAPGQPEDPTKDWKIITDRSRDLTFKIPPTWRAQMQLVAESTAYIPGRTFIGLFADAMPVPTLRLDMYKRPLHAVRREHSALNGGSGSVIKDELTLIDGLPWTRLEFVENAANCRRA